MNARMPDNQYLSYYHDLIVEAITNNHALYHRSPIRLKPGDHVKIPKGKAGTHWLQGKEGEIALEALRQKEFPNKPSRFHCIYSSLIPRARFVDKGYLYRIKPLGKIHVTDSALIDTIMERFDREYYDYIAPDPKAFEEKFKSNPGELVHFLSFGISNRYWNGVSPNRDNIKDIEVLSDGAIVIEEVEESEKSQPFNNGDTVVVTESKKLPAVLALYVNMDSHGKHQNPDVSDEELGKLIKYVSSHIFDNVQSENKFGAYTFKGTLKKGALLKLIDIRHSMAWGRHDNNVKSKYNAIVCEFYIGDNLLHRNVAQNKVNLQYRFMLAVYYEPTVLDFSKYLKKVLNKNATQT